jgi:hypothetical protein
MCGRYALYTPLLAASTSLALVCCSSTRTVAPGGPDGQDRTSQIDEFDSALRELAGARATACGRSPIRSDQSAAIACAQSSIAAGTPFWVAIQVQGIDSILWRGVARGPTGPAWLVTFDSDVHGGGAHSSHARPALARTPCLRLELSIAEPQQISCAVPAGASEVVPLPR